MDAQILKAAIEGANPGGNTGVNVFQEILKTGWLPADTTVEQFDAMPNKKALIDKYYQQIRGMVADENGLYKQIVGGTAMNTNPGGYNNQDAEMLKATLAALQKGQTTDAKIVGTMTDTKTPGSL